MTDPTDEQGNDPAPTGTVAHSIRDTPVVLDARETWLTWLGAARDTDGQGAWAVPLPGDSEDEWGEGPTAVRAKLDPPTIPNNPRPTPLASSGSALASSQVAGFALGSRPHRIPIHEPWEDEDTKEWLPPSEREGLGIPSVSGSPWALLSSSHMNPALRRPLPSEDANAVGNPWAALSASRHDPSNASPTLLSPQDEHPGWYARLKLRDRHLAKLWAYNLTPRDVVVWSADDAAWVPLLAVRQLRAAVLSELQDPDGSVPLGSGIQTLPHGPANLLSGVIESGDEPNSAYTPSSTMPPTVVSVPAPAIPGPPRLPNLRVLTVVGKWSPTLELRLAEFLDAARRVVAGVPKLAASVFEQAPIGYAERAFWMAAGIALVVGVGAGLRASVPRARQLSSAPVTAALRNGQEPPAPRVAAATVAAAPTASERIFSIQELATCAEPAPATVTTQPRVAAVRSHRVALSGKAVATSALPAAAAAQRAGRASQALTAPEPNVPLGAFDAEAARRALNGATQRARLCVESGGARGSMVVVFGPSGAAQSASVAGVVGNARKDCLVRAYSQARVPAFLGAPVTVRKRFDLEYSVQ